MAVLKFAQAMGMSMAAKYLGMGIALTPLAVGSKKPLERNWGRSYYTNESAADAFREVNIGIVLGVQPEGTNSGGIIDIDLDCREAIRLAPYFLPDTSWVFGHASAKRSHYMYRCDGAVTTKFSSGKPGENTGGMVLEIRSTGAQTMAPGSVHPSGEPVRFDSGVWENELPSVVDRRGLEQACGMIAAGSLILRHGWIDGTRDEVCVALCGAMLRSGRSVEDVDRLLMGLAEAAGDEELDMRLKGAYQADRLAREEKVPGIPSLIRWLGGDVTNSVIAWLGIESMNVVNELNTELALVPVGGKTRIVVDGGKAAIGDGVVLMSVSDCRQLYSNRGETKLGKRTVLKFDYWLQSPERRSYSGIVFKPDGCREDEYNLWRGWPLSPVTDGVGVDGKLGCRLMLSHIQDVICNGDQGLTAYVLAWLADALRNPCDKPGVALVLQSAEEGTGKTIFAEYVLRMFGQYVSFVTNSKHLFSKHNFHLANKLMVFADESVWAGNHAHRGVLNSLITGAVLSFEPKGVDSFNLDNHVHLMMATNQDWAVPASMTARRFCVIGVSEHRMDDRRYFAALAHEMKHGGPEALMGYLLSDECGIRDGFAVGAMGAGTGVDLRDIPNTGALQKNKLITMEKDDPIGSWWYGRLREGKITSLMGEWPEIVPIRVLYADYERYAIKKFKNHPSDATFGMFFKRILPHLSMTKKKSNLISGATSLVKPGLIPRQVRCYVMPSLDECREFFCSSVLKSEVEWDEMA